MKNTNAMNENKVIAIYNADIDWYQNCFIKRPEISQKDYVMEHAKITEEEYERYRKVHAAAVKEMNDLRYSAAPTSILDYLVKLWNK